MKKLLLGLLLLSLNAFAAWEPIIQADGLTVDQQWDNNMGRMNYQAVIYGDVAEYMINNDIISEADLNSKGEFVRPIYKISGILTISYYKGQGHGALRRFKVTTYDGVQLDLGRETLNL